MHSCLRVVTEDTEHSSQPTSARYTPMSSTPTHMTMEMNQMMMHPVAEDYYMYQMTRQQHSVRNKRAISYEESSAFVIDIKKVIQDGRTTVMVRNIPNKYSQGMLLELFQSHKKKFDFFYLPIDYTVTLFLFRTIVMLVMLSLILSMLSSFLISTESFI